MRKRTTLLDQVAHPGSLGVAFKEVRRAGGAAGVDGMNLEAFKAQLDSELGKLSQELRGGWYVPLPVRRVYVPKPDGGRRAIGIPAVRDRVVARACQRVLTPRLERLFCRGSFAYRPGRSCRGAVDRAMKFLKSGHWHVALIDIRDYFPSIDRALLMSFLEEVLCRDPLVPILGGMITAGAVEGSSRLEAARGIEQGSPLSPLLANMYLHPWDQALESRKACWVRYSDNALIGCRLQEEAHRELEMAREDLSRLELALNPDKSRVCDARDGFPFLGYHLSSGGIGPDTGAIERLRERLKQLAAREGQVSVETRLSARRTMLQGWLGYYSSLNGLPVVDGWSLAAALQIAARRRDQAGARHLLRQEVAGAIDPEALEVVRETVASLGVLQEPGAAAGEPGMAPGKPGMAPFEQEVALGEAGMAPFEQEVPPGEAGMASGPAGMPDTREAAACRTASTFDGTPSRPTADPGAYQHAPPGVGEEIVRAAAALTRGDYREAEAIRQAAWLEASRKQTDSGRDPAADPDGLPRQDRGRGAGLQASRWAGQEAGPVTGQDRGRGAGQQASRWAGQEAGPVTGQDPGRGAGQQASRWAGQEAGRSAGQDAERRAGQGGARAAGQDAARVAGQSRPGGSPGGPNIHVTLAALSLLRRRFRGSPLQHARMALDRSGRRFYRPVNQPLDEAAWRRHLEGQETLALMVHDEGRLHCAVLDVDIVRPEFDRVKEDPGALAAALDSTQAHAVALSRATSWLGLDTRLEDSGQKGRHVWFFFEPAAPSKEVFQLLCSVRAAAGPPPRGTTCDLIPPSSRAPGRAAGPLVTLPLGIHLQTGRRSTFRDRDGRIVTDLETFVTSIHPCSGSALRDALAGPVRNEEPAMPVVPNDARVRAVLNGCPVMGRLVAKAGELHHLAHLERVALLCVLGHLGAEGEAFLHRVISRCSNYSRRETQKHIGQLKPSPVSCQRLREWLPDVVSRVRCQCVLEVPKGLYPSPVLYAADGGEQGSGAGVRSG